MSNEKDIFTFDLFRRRQAMAPPLPYARGSETSRAAAHAVRDKAPTKEARVLIAIANAGDRGCTDDEIEVVTRLPHQSASARRNGLAKKKLIEKTGERRLTRSGKPADAWRVAKQVT